MNFDYIIVGGGSAGCLLANRLSKNTKHKVLLLEAGKADRHPYIWMPAAFGKLFQTSVDWALETTPQPALHNRRLYQPRGKVLGGSSSINAMIYIRGHRADYDTWSALGNPGWSYDEVLPYFKAFEQNLAFEGPHHGRGGELTVGPVPSINPLSHTLLEAAQQAGFPTNEDFNGPTQEGFGHYQVTQRDGQRCSAARAFLQPIRHRPNLTVLTGALAQHLTFEQRRVTGVFYVHEGQSKAATARRETILSAGAFHSPQLLMRSGIGNAENLRPIGIDLVHHLPGVGQNLQDHLLVGIATHTSYQRTLDGSDKLPRLLHSLYQYYGQRRGPLTSNVAEAGGFWRSDPRLPAPDLQWHFAPAYFVRHGFSNPKRGRGYSLGATLIAPFSKGGLRLVNKNKMAIDPQYLSDERDAQVLLHGFRIAQDILRQQAFDQYRGAQFQPPPNVVSDEEVMEYIRENVETLYHPVGTCKMGNDPTAVVDSQLKVHGVAGLRVVDASIMPTIVRGNTNAPTMMIAEKAASMIAS